MSNVDKRFSSIQALSRMHLLPVLIAGGCFTGSPQEMPACDAVPIEIHIAADKDVNRNAEGQSMPVEVRVLFLSERQRFDSLDFYAVWRDGESELGGDLAKSISVTVFPGSEKIAPVKAPPNVGYVALVALFRQPDETEWKIVNDIRREAKACGADGLHIPVRATIRENQIRRLDIRREG